MNSSIIYQGDFYISNKKKKTSKKLSHCIKPKTCCSWWRVHRHRGSGSLPMRKKIGRGLCAGEGVEESAKSRHWHPRDEGSTCGKLMAPSPPISLLFLLRLSDVITTGLLGIALSRYFLIFSIIFSALDQLFTPAAIISSALVNLNFAAV